jgi:hypothetical protein
MGEESGNAIKTATVSKDSISTANETAKNKNNIQNDIEFSKVSTPDIDTLDKYLKDILKVTYLDGFVTYINDECVKNTIDPLCFIAISLYQTHKGTTQAFKQLNDIGCIPKDTDTSYADIKASIDAMIKDLVARAKESTYLSWLRTSYVTKVVNPEEYAGANLLDLTTNKVEVLDKESHATALQQIQLYWFKEVCKYLTDIYKYVMGGEPAWIQRDITQKTKKDATPNILNAASAIGCCNLESLFESIASRLIIHTDFIPEFVNPAPLFSAEY